MTDRDSKTADHCKAGECSTPTDCWRYGCRRSLMSTPPSSWANPEAPKEGLTTADEIRAELARVAYHDHSVRMVEDIARHRGLSGEDKYVLMAYYALIERAKFKKLALDWAAVQPFGVMAVKEPVGPIDMVLRCPACGTQHIDAPDHDWTNPPHRSHLCHKCGHIWRPADVPTNGVAAIKTKGRGDSPEVSK